MKKLFSRTISMFKINRVGYTKRLFSQINNFESDKNKYQRYEFKTET